jgi:hypothetical protein
MDEWTAESISPTGMSDVAERAMRKFDCGDFIAAIDE